MQPWRISAGLTAVLVCGSRLAYLAPFWRVIFANYGWIVLAGVAAGLADLGRRVDLVERSIRRGEGDPELAEALRRDAQGEWD